MTDIDTIGGILIVPLIVGVVQVAKQTGLPDRWAPLLALVLGIAIGVAWTAASVTALPLDWLVGLLRGATWGLAASGLYSGARHVMARGG